MFDTYLFFDYSGSGENEDACDGIVGLRSSGSALPEQVRERFSRRSLVEFVRREIDQADRDGRRVVFGFDHQYSWPIQMWKLVGLDAKSWRDALRSLVEGVSVGGRHLPPLDIPRRYAAAVNRFVGETVFWCPLAERAKMYGVPNTPPRWGEVDRFRMTERCGFPVRSHVRPKPANAVGGQGEGIVGGQTLCGLRFLHELASHSRIAFWPFDGLSAADGSYGHRHVAIEIYPSGLRPHTVAQSDVNDALYSCQWVQTHDRSGVLASWLDVTHLDAEIQPIVLLEGWIVGAGRVMPALAGVRELRGAARSVETKPSAAAGQGHSSEGCRCCLGSASFERPRHCPECGHQFPRNWIGIDAHWKARHAHVLPYERFWSTLCAGHRK